MKTETISRRPSGAIIYNGKHISMYDFLVALMEYNRLNETEYHPSTVPDSVIVEILNHASR
jgi:5,10-methenyltetrahydromethanopterin hydrogenase